MSDPCPHLSRALSHLLKGTDYMKDEITKPKVWDALYQEFGRDVLLCPEADYAVDEALRSYEPTTIEEAIDSVKWVFFAEWDCALADWLEHVYKPYEGPWTCADEADEMRDFFSSKAPTKDGEDGFAPF